MAYGPFLRDLCSKEQRSFDRAVIAVGVAIVRHPEDAHHRQLV
jgi:hypothetical protein